MFIALLFFVVALVAVGVLFVRANRGTAKPNRAERLAAVASTLGLTLSDDAFNAAALPFSLLGAGTKVGHVMSGTVEGRPTWYFDATTAGTPAAQLSCVLTRLDGTRPACTIVGTDLQRVLPSNESITSVVTGHPSLTSVIDVRSIDVAFATALIDGSLAEFLGRFGRQTAFEVHSNYLLCCTKQQDAAQVALVLKAACAFLASAPADVWMRAAA